MKRVRDTIIKLIDEQKITDLEAVILLDALKSGDISSELFKPTQTTMPKWNEIETLCSLNNDSYSQQNTSATVNIP